MGKDSGLDSTKATPQLGHQQKVGIQVGRSEKVGFYKGTFRAQTRYDRTFSQFFGTF